jgi:Slx4 endonuclease
MAGADCILLSSSPLRPRGVGIITTPSPSSPSSPDFPSLKALLSQKSQLCADGNLITIANDATKSSKTKSLLQDSLNPGYTDTAQASAASKAAAVDAATDVTPKDKVGRMPRADKKNEDSDGVSVAVKKPRRPRAKKADVGAEDGGPKEKPARKPRAKRDNVEGQTKIPRGRITKASTGSASGKSARKEAETTSPYFATQKISSENDLLSQEAVKRRVNWTPPKVTKASPGLDTEEASNDLSGTTDKQLEFSSLVGNFGYISGGDAGGSVRIPEAIGMKKRKLIELVNINSPTPAQLTPKTRTPAKKKRTITELAISAYAKVDEPPAPQPLLQYFSCEDSTGVARVADGFKVPPNPRSRNPTKLVAEKMMSKKTTTQAPILLSPESALQKVSKQDFVFGTSSQLARENSPSMLRGIHQVMKESNQINDPFADVFEGSKIFTSVKGTVAVNSTRSLWSAASHGLDGKMIEVDVVDMVESPGSTKMPHAKTSTSVVRLQNAAQCLPLAKGDEWLQVDGDEPSCIETTEVTQCVQQAIDSPPPTSHSELPRNPPRPKQSSPSRIRSKSPSKSPKQKKGVDDKPNYGSYTTAQLAKEIESYHFKPVKPRERMIALLEKCWEGKQRVALGNVGINAVQPKAPVKSSQGVSSTIAVASSSNGLVERPGKDSETKGPPKRPRKVGTNSSLPSKSIAKDTAPTSEHLDILTPASVVPLVLRQTPKKQRKRTNSIPEEIYDSDVAFIPSPPRRPMSHKSTPPLNLRPSPSPAPSLPDSIDDTILTATLSPASEQHHLHTHITRAITTAPRSISTVGAPAQPSWHEKILLYDPIMLEELAAWLNTGALQRVGWDAEVSPWQVKQWCTAMGVCCLWRENLRGEVRRRF